MRVISADSHMMEPPDLWKERLDNKYKDRAPKVIQNFEGKKGYFFVVEGIRPFPVAGGFSAGNKPEDMPKAWEKGYEGARPSGWDPVERLKDQDIDGVEAEVLYTTLGMSLFGLDDAGFQQACFAAYNDWVAEFCSHSPKRLFGIALISLEDIQAGVKELERCAKKGMRGAMIWGSPPREHPYSVVMNMIRSGRRHRTCACRLACTSSPVKKGIRKRKESKARSNHASDGRRERKSAT